MLRMRGKAVVITLGALAALLPAASGSASIAAVPVLSLELNEPAGSTTAADTHDVTNLTHYDGTIGSHVTMRTETDPTAPDGTGVTKFADFDRHPPNEGIDYGLDHLIAVPDAADGSLDPGAVDFTIQMRFRTSSSYGNILQKGQSKTPGGQVKIQAPGGRIQCMFKSPEGRAGAGTGTPATGTTFNDGRWHVLRCERTPLRVTLWIDGVRYGRTSHFTGNINNTKPWTLGGKPECDAVEVTCDYYPGDIDYVRMWKG